MSEQAPPDEDRSVDDEGREFIARRHRFPANGTGFLIAPVLWFGYFMLVYALQGVGCAREWDLRPLLGTTVLQVLLGSLTTLVAAAIVALGIWSYRSWKRLLEELEEEEQQIHGHSTFLAYGALLHAGLFLVATLWTGAPILLLDACGTMGTSG